MNSAKIFLSTLVLGSSLATFTGCSKSGDADDHAATAAAKVEAQSTAGVTLDAATQTRLGLETATPVATQWHPAFKAYGVVMDPAVLASASADLEAARVAADASDREYARQKTLASQNNSSARALEAAHAAASHDDLALAAALVKFKADWGTVLAENGKEILPPIVSNHAALVRIELPAGENLPSPPVSASLVLSTVETNPVDAGFFDSLTGVDPRTQGQSYLFLLKDQALPPNAAVTAYLKTPGEPVPGVTIPVAAVLRYEGRGWIYLQTGTNGFLRSEIPLDYPVAEGWFVPESVPLTNSVVVVGAQSVLSAELSGGAFNTGERD